MIVMQGSPGCAELGQLGLRGHAARGSGLELGPQSCTKDPSGQMLEETTCLLLCFSNFAQAHLPPSTCPPPPTHLPPPPHTLSPPAPHIAPTHTLGPHCPTHLPPPTSLLLLPDPLLKSRTRLSN